MPNITSEPELLHHVKGHDPGPVQGQQFSAQFQATIPADVSPKNRTADQSLPRTVLLGVKVSGDNWQITDIGAFGRQTRYLMSSEGMYELYDDLKEYRRLDKAGSLILAAITVPFIGVFGTQVGYVEGACRQFGGREITCRMTGRDTWHGRAVTKFYATGWKKSVSLTGWIDDELGRIVKIVAVAKELQSPYVAQLINLRVEPQPEADFSIPSDYQEAGKSVHE